MQQLYHIDYGMFNHVMKKYSFKMWYKIEYNWAGVLIVSASAMRKFKLVSIDLNIAIFQKLIAH